MAVVGSVRDHRECTLEGKLVERVSKDGLGMMGTKAYERVWAKDAEGLGVPPPGGTVGAVAVVDGGVRSGSHGC